MVSNDSMSLQLYIEAEFMPILISALPVCPALHTQANACGPGRVLYQRVRHEEQKAELAKSIPRAVLIAVLGLAAPNGMFLSLIEGPVMSLAVDYSNSEDTGHI